MPSPLRALSRRISVTAALVLGFTALPALAADAVFLVVSGEVRIVRTGETPQSAARSGDELRSGDLIVTSRDGRAQLRFSDGAIVSLQPGTEFRIDDYRFDPQEQRGFFSLLRGAMRTTTGAIGKRNRSDYRMQTPTATIGIRGTLYLAEETVCDPACAPGARAGLRVSVSEGRIAVRTAAGEIEVGEGTAAEVSSPDALPRLTELRPLLTPATLFARAASDLASSVRRGAPPAGAEQASEAGTPTASAAAPNAAGPNAAGPNAAGPNAAASGAAAQGASRAGASASTKGSAGADDRIAFETPDGSASPLQSSSSATPAASRAADGRLDLLAAIDASPSVPPDFVIVDPVNPTPPNPPIADGSGGGSSGGGSSGGGSSGGGSTGGGSTGGGSTGGGSTGGGSTGGGSTGGGSTGGGSTGGGSTGGGSTGGGSTGGGSTGGGSTGGGSTGGGSTGGGSTGGGSTGGGSTGGGSTGGGSTGGGSTGGGSTGGGSTGGGSTGGGSTGGGSTGGDSTGGGSTGGGSTGGGSTGGGSTGGGSTGGGSTGGGSTGGGSTGGGSTGGGSTGGGSTGGGSTGGGSTGGGTAGGDSTGGGSTDGGSTGGGSTGGGTAGGDSTGGGSTGGGSTGGGSTGGGSTGGGSTGGGSTGGGTAGGDSTGGGSTGGGSTGGGSTGGGSTGGGSTGGGSTGGGSTGGGSTGGGSTGGGSTGGGSTGGGSTGGGTAGGDSTGGGSTGGGSTGGGSTGGGSTGGGSTGGGSTGGGSTGGGSTGGGSTGGGSTGGSSPPAELPLATGLASTGSLRLDLRQIPIFGSLQFASPDGRVELDSQLRLESVGLCPQLACLSRGTAAHADSGSDPYASWGRWTNGSADVRVLGIGARIALGANQSIHYLVGVPTVTMPTSGSFRYELLGATSPTASDGSLAPGSFKMSAVAQFSSGEAARIGLQGSVKMGNGQFNISTNGGLGNPKSSELTMQGGSTFSGSLVTQPNAGNAAFDCGRAGCAVRVDGAFYGPEAARLGLGYAIVDPSTPGRTISGVGVLQKR
nr:FecR family protein [Quisquiliibacterium transsilvanicum]